MPSPPPSIMLFTAGWWSATRLCVLGCGLMLWGGRRELLKVERRFRDSISTHILTSPQAQSINTTHNSKPCWHSQAAAARSSAAVRSDLAIRASPPGTPRREFDGSGTLSVVNGSRRSRGSAFAAVIETSRLPLPIRIHCTRHGPLDWMLSHLHQHRQRNEAAAPLVEAVAGVADEQPMAESSVVQQQQQAASSKSEASGDACRRPSFSTCSPGGRLGMVLHKMDGDSEASGVE